MYRRTIWNVSNSCDSFR